MLCVQLSERIGCQDQAMLEHVDELLGDLPKNSVDETNDNDMNADAEEEKEQSEGMDTQ